MQITQDSRLAGVSIERMARPAGFVMHEAHLHACYELYYLDRGSCSIFVDGKLFRMQAGNGICIPPGVLHSTSYDGSEGAVRTAVFFREEDLVYRNLEMVTDADRHFRKTSFFVVPEVQAEQMEQQLSSMLLEQKKHDAASLLLLDLACKELFLFLSVHAEFEDELPGMLHTGDRCVLAAARYIREHYADEISGPMLAQQAGCSEGSLRTKFHEATGMGVHEYLMITRLKHAAADLSDTGKSITEIALSCGYQSPGYFKDAFRKVYGLSPRAYRRKFQT